MGAVPSARLPAASPPARAKPLPPHRQSKLKKEDVDLRDVELIGRFTMALRTGTPPKPPTKKSSREDVLLYMMYAAVYETRG